MSRLRKGWAETSLGDLIELKYGKALPDRERSGNGFPVFGSNGMVGYHNTALTAGATVVIGRKGSVGEVNFSETPCSPIDTTYYVDSFPGGQSKYWYYKLRSLPLKELNKSTAIPGVSRSDVYPLEITLPPLPEQKRIADKLDSVLARVDACRDRLDRLPALLKRFRQSILAAATSGKLTEDWRNTEASSASWQNISLGKYVENLDGKRVPISETLRTSRRGQFPYYGASGVIDTIDGYTHDGKFLLIGEDGANLLTRSKPIAFIATGKIWVNNHAHVLKCKHGAPEEYLCYFINSIDLTPFVSGSAQPKLNQKNMNSIEVPVPPVKEQTEIVRRVEILFAFADRLEARLATARRQVGQLTPALLAKAFRGELVPQDPADEPAAELLKRLAAQREAAPKAKRGRASKA